MNRTESKDRPVFWAAPMLLGLLLILGGTLAGAALLSAGSMQQRFAPLAAYVPLGLGTLVAAFWGARRAPSRKFLMGMLIGLCLLGCLFLLGFAMRESACSAPAAGIVSGIILVAAVLGAIPGSAARKKKTRRR